MRDLDAGEEKVLKLLGKAANRHGRLVAVHPSDQEEFTRAIHAAQNIILARPATEEQQSRLRPEWEYPEDYEGPAIPIRRRPTLEESIRGERAAQAEIVRVARARSGK